MRVIRHESGWDIALDLVFTDKTTAETIAYRIRQAMHALIRDAVDSSMCGRKTGQNAPEDPPSPILRTIDDRDSKFTQPQER
jgi:hypothetical protein